MTEEELDLLVEDELAEEHRRDVLARLAADAEGWKRCAQGFLEVQVWQRALGEEVERPVSGAPRRWLAPLASVAAAVAGFAAALLVLPTDRPPVASGSAPADPEVRWVPYPVVQHTGLVPASDEDGRRYYTARGDVPPFVLRALEEAGHDVERVERVVQLPREEGEPIVLPVSETRVVEKLEL